VIWTIAVCALWGTFVAASGALLTVLDSWYYNLRKPSWQPPDWLFGPAWTVILALASYAAYLGWTRAQDAGERTLVVALFGANAIFHVLWSLLFFKLQRPDWSLIEVAFLWLSILAMIIGLAAISWIAAMAIVPYILWVSFAAFLNLTIVRLNRPFGTR
jgi:benzodiazapine receptor